MSEKIVTNEFSICLLPDNETVRQIQEFRKCLPDSPYRDDTPHITLVRGITMPKPLSDHALAAKISDITNVPDHLPCTARVEEVANKSNQFYSLSGLLLLQPDKRFIGLRASVIAALLAHDFHIDQQEISRYMPHMTIRLGVPLEGYALDKAQKKFSQQPIIFTQPVLFRLIKEGNARFMRQISL